jgi:hypothetical protein
VIWNRKEGKNLLLHSCRTGPMFDPLRQFFVAGSNVAHRLLSISVVHGFGSSLDFHGSRFP